MFFVTILLNEVLAWTRSQSGTSSLRAILYMDEVFGYFPPTANPPSKTPMLTLLKQARAFGLGIVLATQNPVDLDYKGLSNTGTWFVFVTVMVNVAAVPVRIVWVSGVFSIWIAGSITVTSASSLSVTVPPAAWVPTTDAVLVKSAVTLAAVQV